MFRRKTLGATLPADTARLLERTVSEKDRYEHQGYVATVREAEATFSKAERFGAWAEQALASRPRRGWRKYH
jgi:hypothetical protein